MSNKDPAFLFYSSDFLTGTMFFTDAQAGQYIRLLCAQHQKGHLKMEDMLAICKTQDNQVIGKFKKDKNGRYYNERMEGEVLRRRRYCESRGLNKRGKTKQQKTLTPIQILVEHYKKIKKYDALPNWDKEHFARASASAKRILSQADDETQACDAITKIGSYHDNEGLSWTIETIVKKFPDWKLGKLKPKERKSQQSKLRKDLNKIAEFGKE